MAKASYEKAQPVLGGDHQAWYRWHKIQHLSNKRGRKFFIPVDWKQYLRVWTFCAFVYTRCRLGRSSPPLNRWYPLGILWKTKHCAQLQLADLRFDVPQNSLKISSFKSYQFKPLPPRKFEQFQHHNSISIRSPCSNSELRLKLNFMSQGLLPVEKVPWKAPAMRIRRRYSSVAQTKTRRSQR